MQREADAPTGRFDAPATAYDRGRPGYPAELVPLLLNEIGLTPASVVVDLGAGTGKLTELLETAGFAVKAVEPLAGMRERLTRLGVEVLAGTAEELPLADHSVDAIVAAQAFHWFDYEKALPAIHRVLAPGGALCLVWNRRRQDEPWLRHYAELIAPYRDEGKTYDSVDWQTPLEASPLFGPIQLRVLSYEQVLTVDRFVDRVRSLGYVARLPAPERTNLLDSIRALVEPVAAQARGELRVTYETLVYWCLRT